MQQQRLSKNLDLFYNFIENPLKTKKEKLVSFFEEGQQRYVIAKDNKLFLFVNDKLIKTESDVISQKENTAFKFDGMRISEVSVPYFLYMGSGSGTRRRISGGGDNSNNNNNNNNNNNG